MSWLRISCLAAIIVLLAAAHWQVQPLAAQTAPSATLCTDINFAGTCITLTRGTPSFSALVGTGALARNVSSVRLTGQIEVALFDQTSFQGNCVTLQQSVPDLRASPYNFNDKTASVDIGVTCELESAPRMWLYPDTDFGGVRKTIFGSVPDLRAAAYDFNDTTSSIQISPGTVWAVYSDINFAGTCETVTEDIPWLGATNVGNDAISSLRSNFTCAGPVANSYVTDITAVHGNSRNISCPSGYTKKWQDLNQGVGGDFVFACVQYGSDPSKALQEIYVFTSTQCHGSDQAVNVDLNSGARDGLGVGFPIFFCKHRQNTNGGSGSLAGSSGLFDKFFSAGTKVRDLNFYVSTSMPPCLVSCGGIGADAAAYLESAVNVQPLCQNAFSGAWQPVFLMYQSPSGDTTSRVSGDAATMNLNQGMTSLEHPNFAWIYGCVREGNAVLAKDNDVPAVPPVSPDTTPPTIKPVAVWTASNCSMFCTTQSVSNGGTVTHAGTVTVSWTCTDDRDPAPNASDKASFSQNGVHTVTGVCTDAAGNQSAATFSFTINVA